MTVKFNAVARRKPGEPEELKKFYPLVYSSGRVTTRQLAVKAAQRSTLSAMDVAAAIEAFLEIIPQELAEGNIVELGDFGNFWLRTESTGVELEEDVRAGQITAILPRFNPGKEFKRALKGVDFEKTSKPPIPQPVEEPAP